MGWDPHHGPSVSVSSLWPTVPPRFVNKIRAAPFMEGEDVQLTCTIEGTPHPQIRWACGSGGGGGLVPTYKTSVGRSSAASEGLALGPWMLR